MKGTREGPRWCFARGSSRPRELRRGASGPPGGLEAGRGGRPEKGNEGDGGHLPAASAGRVGVGGSTQVVDAPRAATRGITSIRGRRGGGGTFRPRAFQEKS